MRCGVVYSKLVVKWIPYSFILGVGIRGSEGLQAFNVSDYGISRFKDLAPLYVVYVFLECVLLLFFKELLGGSLCLFHKASCSWSLESSTYWKARHLHAQQNGSD